MPHKLAVKKRTVVMKSSKNLAFATLFLAITASSLPASAAEFSTKLVELAVNFGEQAEALRDATNSFFNDDKNVAKARTLGQDELRYSLSVTQWLIELRMASNAMNQALLISSFAPNANADAITKHLTAMCSELVLVPIPGSSPRTLSKFWVDTAVSEFPHRRASAEKAAVAYVAAAEAAASDCATIAAGNWNKQR